MIFVMICVSLCLIVDSMLSMIFITKEKPHHKFLMKSIINKNMKKFNKLVFIYFVCAFLMVCFGYIGSKFEEPTFEHGTVRFVCLLLVLITSLLMVYISSVINKMFNN